MNAKWQVNVIFPFFGGDILWGDAGTEVNRLDGSIGSGPGDSVNTLLSFQAIDTEHPLVARAMQQVEGRYPQYDESVSGIVNTKVELFEFYHNLSTYGSWILLAGFLLIAFYLIRSLFNGKAAGSNPWGSLTKEWEVPSPPPPPPPQCCSS